MNALDFNELLKLFSFNMLVRIKIINININSNYNEYQNWIIFIPITIYTIYFVKQNWYKWKKFYCDMIYIYINFKYYLNSNCSKYKWFT